MLGFSNGNDLANALGQSISGGQCANGLKMAVRVNPPPGTGSPSDLTSTADPGNSGELLVYIFIVEWSQEGTHCKQCVVLSENQK